MIGAMTSTPRRGKTTSNPRNTSTSFAPTVHPAGEPVDIPAPQSSLGHPGDVAVMNQMAEQVLEAAPWRGAFDPPTFAEKQAHLRAHLAQFAPTETPPGQWRRELICNLGALGWGGRAEWEQRAGVRAADLAAEYLTDHGHVKLVDTIRDTCQAGGRPVVDDELIGAAYADAYHGTPQYDIRGGTSHWWRQLHGDPTCLCGHLVADHDTDTGPCLRPDGRACGCTRCLPKPEPPM